MGDADRVCAGQHQLLRQAEGRGLRRAVAEAPRVGQHRGVEAGGHLRRHRGPGGLHQPVHQFAHARGLAVDPIQVGKLTPGGVVIDIDQEKPLQAEQPRPLQPIALQQDGGVIGALDASARSYLLGPRQRPVDLRNPLRRHHVGVLAQLFQQHSHGQHRAHRIAVGPRVRTDQEPLAPAQSSRIASIRADGQRA